MIARRAIAGLLAASVAACAVNRPDPPVTANAALDSFPPMPSGMTPGASAHAVAVARTLGRGINFGNMLEAPSEGAWGLRVEDRFIELIGKTGMPDTVRLPVRWSNHASANAGARIEPAFMARVADVVDRLLARGATVVLNMHHYRQLDGDRLDAGEQAVDPGVVDLRFLALWQQIADRFAHHGPRLLFEVYNEPHGRLETRWNDLLSRTVRVIRTSNPTRPLVVGPVAWNSATALPRLQLPADPNLILTVHHYEPFDFTHQGAEWVVPRRPVGVDCCDAAQLDRMHALLDQAVRESARLGYPVFVGEFGAYAKAPAAARVRYSRAMRDAMETRGLPWMYWELAAGFGVYDPVAGRVRQELVEALFGP